jgi:hypothetical protein
MPIGYGFGRVARRRPPDVVEPPPTGGVRWISPTGTGNGTTAALAGDIANLNQYIADVGPGGVVNIIANQGDYNLAPTLYLSNGGTAAARVIVRGVDADGVVRGKAQIRKGRTSPWPAAARGASAGGTIFQMNSGANFINFKSLRLRDCKWAMLVTANITGMIWGDRTYRDTAVTNLLPPNYIFDKTSSTYLTLIEQIYNASAAGVSSAIQIHAVDMDNCERGVDTGTYGSSVESLFDFEVYGGTFTGTGQGFFRIRGLGQNFYFQDCNEDGGGGPRDGPTQYLSSDGSNNWAVGWELQARRSSDSLALYPPYHTGVLYACFVRCTANANRSSQYGDVYFNGDGFSGESGNDGCCYIRCTANDNEDGGLETKALNVTAIGFKSYRNGRNFRIWGSADLFHVDVRDAQGGNKKSAVQVFTAATKEWCRVFSGTIVGTTQTVFECGSGQRIGWLVVDPAVQVTRDASSTLFNMLASDGGFCGYYNLTTAPVNTTAPVFTSSGDRAIANGVRDWYYPTFNVPCARDIIDTDPTNDGYVTAAQPDNPGTGLFYFNGWSMLMTSTTGQYDTNKVDVNHDGIYEYDAVGLAANYKRVVQRNRVAVGNVTTLPPPPPPTSTITTILARMTTAGATPTTARTAIYQTFIDTMVNSGVANKSTMMLVPKSHALAAAKLGWIGPDLEQDGSRTMPAFIVDAGFRSVSIAEWAYWGVGNNAQFGNAGSIAIAACIEALPPEVGGVDTRADVFGWANCNVAVYSSGIISVHVNGGGEIWVDPPPAPDLGWTSTFDNLDGWTPSGAAYVSGGILNLPITGNTYSGVDTIGRINIINSSASLEYVNLSTPTTGFNEREIEFYLYGEAGQSAYSAGISVHSGESGGKIFVRTYVNSVSTIPFNEPWSLSTHRHVRFRDNGTTLFFERSPDNSTWTTMYSRASIPELASSRVSIAAGNWGPGETNSFQLDNFRYFGRPRYIYAERIGSTVNVYTKNSFFSSSTRTQASLTADRPRFCAIQGGSAPATAIVSFGWYGAPLTATERTTLFTAWSTMSTAIGSTIVAEPPPPPPPPADLVLPLMAVVGASRFRQGYYSNDGVDYIETTAIGQFEYAKMIGVNFDLIVYADSVDPNSFDMNGMVFAQDGDIWSSMRNRLPKIIASDATVVLVNANIGGIQWGETVATWTTNYKNILQTLIDAGKYVVAEQIWERGSLAGGVWAIGAGPRLLCAGVNADMETWCAARGIPFVRASDVLIDINGTYTPNREPLPGMVRGYTAGYPQTGDTTHLSHIGAWTYGKEINRVLTAAFSPPPVLNAADAAGNKVSNPLMSGVGGTLVNITGQLADGYTATRRDTTTTIVASKVSKAPTNPRLGTAALQWQQFVISNTAALSGRGGIGNLTTTVTGLTVGKWYRGNAKVEVDASTSYSGVSGRIAGGGPDCRMMSVVDTGGGTGQGSWAANVLDFPNEAMSLMFQSMPFQATQTSMTFAFDVGVKGGGSQSLTVRFTGFELRETTDPHLIMYDEGNNTVPTFTSPAAFTVTEGQSVSLDVNVSEPCSFALSGADAALFTIDAAGIIRGGPFNYLAPIDVGANNVYNLTVTATVTNKTPITQNVTITVLQVSTAEFVDTFTGTNGTDIAVNNPLWTRASGVVGGIIIDTNRAKNVQGTVTEYLAPQQGDTRLQHVSWTMDSMTLKSYIYILYQDVQNNVKIGAYSSGMQWTIQKLVNNALSTSLVTMYKAFEATDTWDVIVTDANTVNVYQNNVKIGTMDVTGLFTASRRCGLRSNNQAGGGTYDNFRVRPYAGGYVEKVALNTLTMAPLTGTTATQYVGTLTGRTVGSTIALVSVTPNNLGWIADGDYIRRNAGGVAGTYTVTISETLVNAVNSGKQTTFTVVIS